MPYMGGQAIRDRYVAESKQISTTGVPSEAKIRLARPAPCGPTMTAAWRHETMSDWST